MPPNQARQAAVQKLQAQRAKRLGQEQAPEDAGSDDDIIPVPRHSQHATQRAKHGGVHNRGTRRFIDDEAGGGGDERESGDSDKQPKR